MENNKQLINKLNGLLSRTYDAILGYKNAADNVKNAELKAFFLEQAEQRRKFAADITIEITNYGGEPINEGTFEGTVHRAWMDISAALASNKEEDVIEECVRGEWSATEEYDDLLEKDVVLGSKIHQVITYQKVNVNLTLQKLEMLKSVLH